MVIPGIDSIGRQARSGEEDKWGFKALKEDSGLMGIQVQGNAWLGV